MAKREIPGCWVINLGAYLRLKLGELEVLHSIQTSDRCYDFKIFSPTKSEIKIGEFDSNYTQLKISENRRKCAVIHTLTPDPDKHRDILLEKQKNEISTWLKKCRYARI
jgi:hypothetical protein